MSEPKTTTAQSIAILAALKSGAKLTPLSMLTRFGCLRASARIYDLRGQGHPIKSVLVKVGKSRYVAEYSLVTT